MTEHNHNDLNSRMNDLVGEVRDGRREQRDDHAKVREELSKLNEVTQDLGSEVRQLKTKVDDGWELAQTTAGALSTHIYEHDSKQAYADGKASVWRQLTNPLRKAVENLDKVAIVIIAIGGGAVGVLIGLTQ